VAVGVEGHGYCGVPEKFLYQFRVNTPAQEQGGAGVTEVVEAYVGPNLATKCATHSGTKIVA
jgi:hypothetical protein